MSKETIQIPKQIEEMFATGAHFGFSKSRRHPSFKNYIFGQKNNVEIVDLEKTQAMLLKVKEFIASLGKEGKTILFVSSKSEAKEVVKTAAESIAMPYVAGRWIGGTLTNFPEIKKRVSKLHDWNGQKEKGDLQKYTKKERLLIDREIVNLEKFFGGIKNMEKLPHVLFVIDPRREHIAVAEAEKMNIPVVALASTDCDVSKALYFIPANDSSKSSIEYFLKEVTSAYKGK